MPSQPMPEKLKLEAILEPIENTPVECDGFMRLATTLLANHKIPHKVCKGSLVINKDSKLPHFWLETDTYCIDYTARMWTRSKETPHGVFTPVKSLYQDREEVEIAPVCDMLFFILANMSLNTAIEKGIASLNLIKEEKKYVSPNCK